ncbi:MAG: glycosyltransferase family 4 protein [Bryobacteraceae bacterium]
MRIALDATYSAGSNLSGVGVYSSEILSGLARAHPETRFLWCYRTHRLLASLHCTLPPNARRRLLGESRPPSAALFHGLNQRLPPRRSGPTVVTFHDLFVLTEAYSTREFRRRFAAQARDAAEKADLIIAVSRFTAGQVEELLGVDPRRIRVISHGVRPAGPATAAREPMILFVGAVQTRKNVLRLVEAFEQMPAGWRMVLAGSAGFGAGEILSRIAASPRATDIEIPGYVPDARLRELYRAASIFAFPSLDEGFGMPVLEAMAYGVPVVTSRRSALPEVAGDAALLVDPESVEEIAGALRRLAGDPALAASLTSRGLARARSFPWADAVARTWAVYRELVPLP